VLEEDTFAMNLDSKERLLNPLYDCYLADPFIYYHDGEYFILGTGPEDMAAPGYHSERAFPIISSRNLIDWRFRGHALAKLPSAYGTHYWAPSVAVRDGEFFLYYSVGFGDKLHHLRVAKSGNPLGPFEDSGVLLTDPSSLPFAIDSHPIEIEGTWYLAYAKDFLSASNDGQVGTGLVIDTLDTMEKLAGSPRVIARPKFQRQIFEAKRIIYGRVVDWYTAEGPCLMEHEGKVFCLYSSGRWEDETYGLDFAVASSPEGPWIDKCRPDRASLLGTIPSVLRGPGHNSYLRDPKSGVDVIVFHAWDSTMTLRRPHLTTLEWTEEGPRCPAWISLSLG
jgi:GH43 family beta-xylosidase